MDVDKKSGKALLFLYEGDTEGEFYDLIFERKFKSPSIKIKRKNLEGNYNIHKKVAASIDNYLENNPFVSSLNVIVAIDREGPKDTEITFNKDTVIKRLNTQKLSGIDEIVITQDLESSFFIDIEGIYTFLKTPITKRKPGNYNNYMGFNNKTLSKLFRDYGKTYVKGKRTENFINHLDIDKIIEGCKELKEGIGRIEQLVK